MKGVDIRTVQELLGHKTIQMTVRYAHLGHQHKLAAVERLCEPVVIAKKPKKAKTVKHVEPTDPRTDTESFGAVIEEATLTVATT